MLKLGEFQDVDTLTLSEASLVINALLAKRKKDRKDRNETEILNKTLDYLDAFARIKGKENVEAAERLLSARKELTKFERAQIGKIPRLENFCGRRVLPGMDEDLLTAVMGGGEYRLVMLRDFRRGEDAHTKPCRQDQRRGPADVAGRTVQAHDQLGGQARDGYSGTGSGGESGEGHALGGSEDGTNGSTVFDQDRGSVSPGGECGRARLWQQGPPRVRRFLMRDVDETGPEGTEISEQC